MKTNFIFIVALILSGTVFGQNREYYISKYCDCYIEPIEKYSKFYKKPFIPTHSDIDTAEIRLRLTKGTLKQEIGNLEEFIRYYYGFIDEKGHKVLYIYADCKPDKEGRKISDCGWVLDFDLNTKKFSNFNFYGG